MTEILIVIWLSLAVVGAFAGLTSLCLVLGHIWRHVVVERQAIAEQAALEDEGPATISELVLARRLWMAAQQKEAR